MDSILLNTTDHAAAQDSVTARAVDVSARVAVIEAAALLRVLGHRESADKLVQYHDKVERRTKARATVAIHAAKVMA